VREIPERASGVQLLGEMAASGYRRPPALARRDDGQMIKLTPLLYQLAEAIDGRRDHEELAGLLSRRTGRIVSADDVRFLIDQKLRPLGMVGASDAADGPPLARANPLLALRPRVVCTKPGVTRALTAPFLWLYHPVVLSTALAGFAAVVVWLLAEKGLSSPLHQAFYEPGLILVVWGLVLASAAFHEIGHATACRYGGARPGVMGAGLYLVWPAFYTEVTDAYRLDRRARLRVDLGGLYFSALFALMVFAVWYWNGTDALLLVIAVELIQMVRQLAPFVRADGYHLIADTIGVPDLFAHIKPTLLGLLPGRRHDPRSQALKPSARVVVAVWVAVSVPALIIVLGAIVLAFPRLAATGLDSAGIRWDEAARYWSEGDPTGVAMSASSILLVALPVASVVYLVGYLTQRVGRKAWRSTAGRPGRRALVCLGGIGLVAALAWAWWPDEGYQPISSTEGGPAPTVLEPPPDEMAVVPQSATFLPAPAQQLAVLATAPPGSALPPGAPLTEASNPAGGPDESAPAGRAERSLWPFPFDRPEAPGPGDNQALAANVEDGSEVWDIASSLQLISGSDAVDNTNEAYAFADCADCRTGAIAFQIVLILGYVDDILPWNTALALNYDCERCQTYALAYQIVFTLAEAPTAELIAELEQALRRVDRLATQAPSMTILEIIGVLEGVREDVLAALAEPDGTVVGDDAAGSLDFSGDPGGLPEDTTASGTGVEGDDATATTQETAQPTDSSGQTTTTDGSTTTPDTTAPTGEEQSTGQTTTTTTTTTEECGSGTQYDASTGTCTTASP